MVWFADLPFTQTQELQAMAYKMDVPPRRTSEFQHYDGCRCKDPDNCSGCALTTGGKEGPNYAAWPLVYVEHHRIIPRKWQAAFEQELKSSNTAYAENLKATVEKHGVEFR
jgi:hypothetical protein